MTIAVGNGRRFEPSEAARFSFLLGIPAIAGGGLLEMLMIADTTEFGPELIIGVVAAAISGYFAIAILLKALGRVGLVPFAIYCLLVGVVTVIVF
jgi:undecaprenyl-diphosphatase